jgi:uncharacterized protein YcbK (DUF882 family)
MMNLTDPLYPDSHFTWGEFTKNGTRLPQLTRFEGRIYTSAQITANGILIAQQLDKIRAQFGDRPIHITSWLRPPAINQAVGGVANSQHIIGWAADIQIEGYTPNQVAERLTNSWSGGLGDSTAFTHLDLRDRLGLASARWDYGFA